MNPIIKKDKIRVSDVDVPASKPRRGHAKVVHLLREGGEVRGIEFRCSCGDTTVIALEYGAVEAPVPAEAAPPVTEEMQG